MKLRYLILFLLSVLTLAAAKADKYRIIHLNTPHITINGVKCKKNDLFNDVASIKWVNSKQKIEVKNETTGKIYRFSEKIMKQKSAKSLKDYFDYFKLTKRGSVRGGGSFTASPVKDHFRDKRIALVMGNSNYESLDYLPNPHNDASDISDVLLSLGFDVIEAYECDYEEMEKALADFSKRAENYGVALFYYAGHGTQEDNQNYLVPVDCNLRYRTDLENCMNADNVLERMEGTGAKSRLLFFDACRNQSGIRGDKGGFVRMEGVPGTVIMFSTLSGKVAYDGEGDNSPFAMAMIENIQKPDKEITEVLKEVTRTTYFSTGERQYPLQVGVLINDFYFLRTKTDNELSNVVAAEDEDSLEAKAEAGDAEAQYRLGIQLYYKSENKEAAKWLTKSAAQGYAKAASLLGKMYCFGTGVPKNYMEAYRWCKESAENGDAMVQYCLGYMYKHGRGVSADDKEAARWFLKSAEQGDAEAQFQMAVIYFCGEGVPEDEAEAFKWLKASAEQGNKYSLYYIGMLYYNGWGIKENYAEAFKWLKKAAEAGNERAYFNLGLIYYNGEGVEKNYAEALQWFKKAASQGDAKAKYNVGLMYFNGEGVLQNHSEALKWFKEAAEQNK